MSLTQAKQAFLAQAGWAQSRAEKMAGDASIKIFHRILRDNGESAILMEFPIDHSQYSHEAGLACTCLPFLAISDWLRAQALSIP